MGVVLTFSEACEKSLQIEKSLKKLVLVGGYFDLLHIGHALFLQRCKENGDFLMVYIHNDNTTKLVKGSSRPIIPAYERANLLSFINCVDYCVIVPELKVPSGRRNLAFVERLDDELIQKIAPSVYVCIQGEYNSHERSRNLQARHKRTKIVTIPRQSLVWSTTKIESIMSESQKSMPIEPDDFSLKTNRSLHEKEETWLFPFIEEAKLIAQNSKCKIRKVGAIVVYENKPLGYGVNRIPSNLKNCWCFKHKGSVLSGTGHPVCFSLHAEQVAILNALDKGYLPKQCSLVSTNCPCINCAKILIEHSFKKVYYLDEYTDLQGRNLLIEAGISVARIV